MSPLLEIIALHHLVVGQGTGQGTIVKAIGAAAPSAIDPRARDRLLQYHDDVLDRQEFNGGAVRAWWDGAGQPQALSGLLSCSVGEFAAQTEQVMQRLAREAKGNAKSGLVAFARVRDDGATRLACFKLDLTKLEEVQWRSGKPLESALVAIDVDQLLPHAEQLQKAAVYPGPKGAQVWVVDDQLATPADYWMRFLGARAYPGEKQRLQQVIAATTRTLVEGLHVADPQPAIARAVAAARQRDEATLPADFAREVAEAAGVSADAVIDETTAHDPRLLDRDFSITPLAARQTRTTYDLGGGVKLTGPRGVVEERVEELAEGGEQFLKVLVTNGPHISYS